MRTIILFFFTALSVCCSAQVGNPFQSLKYDKVVFYDFEIPGEKDFLIIDAKGNVQQKLIKHVTLDDVTISTFNKKLGEKKSFGGGTASCFDPHCGLVYFLKNKPVAQIAICISCNRLRSTLEIKAQQQGRVGKGDDSYYLQDGMSKSFRKYLNGLLKKYNFSHQIKPGSSFDK